MTEGHTVGTMPESNDVVLLLRKQHGQIRDLLDQVADGPADRRRESFERLTHLLVVHETAEQEIDHTYLRRSGGDGERVAARRTAEEDDATRALDALVAMDPDDAGFAERFRALRRDLLDHAAAEEDEEFPLLHDMAGPAALQAMAKATRAAEMLAPTRPHPGLDSVPKKAAAGPLAGLADRTRDAVRAVREHLP
ncbi:hemerythrin domain-containing protein [Streptomyces sp. ICBB 8177]|uniref:hemerythrin domain-containing protein n=1 Tax=Streptomyces sp. ICBB 8177 TaxID=563922 RepID=UPI000D682AA5|nr:hemerythrin domain-containing protein [Streptomyces sp. ICBB 8177]PWI42973.1 hemerythrin [Streptomyces sp. ICBB 8177]